MQLQITPITPFSQRYCLAPAAVLSCVALLTMLVWANTGNRRVIPHDDTVLHGEVSRDTAVVGSPPTVPNTARPTPPHHTGRVEARGSVIAGQTASDLIAQLQTGDENTRRSAAEALASHSPYVVIPRLQPWVDQQLAEGTLTDAALGDVLALYRRLGVVNPELLRRALATESVRAQAVRTLGEWWGRMPGRYALLAAAADDASGEVRSEVLRVCLIADHAQAAGIAQLIRGHPMDAELAAAYDAVMSRLARHGPPIPAASRRQRIAAMSYEQLLKEPRDGEVLVALLRHPDLPAQAFEPTLAEAAELAGAAPVDQLIGVVSASTVLQLRSSPLLGLALAHRPTDELAPRLTRLLRMASDEQTYAATYAAAAVARVMLNDDEPATLEATRQALGDTQLLARISMIPEPAVRNRMMPIVTGLLSSSPPQSDGATANDVRVLAVHALPHLPAAAGDLFGTLADIARGDSDTAVRFAAIKALADIPADNWPAGHDDLTLTRITVRTVPNLMQYAPKAFNVTAGRPVVVTLVNPDTMEHNLVITAVGRLTDVGLDAAMLGDDGGPNRDFIPDSPHVLHHTDILKPGETATLQFIAPETPGDYPFVCTYPGHWTTMNGIMHVIEP